MATKYIISISILFFCFKIGSTHDRPIIGIVTEELYNPKNNYTTSIYASYIKFVESSGARVVPIWIDRPVEYYKDLLGKINGVLFPGGGVDLQGTGYGRTGKIIFGIATQMNDAGDYFPLWGTCLGFELLTVLATKKNWLTKCAAMDLPKNLHFITGYNSSKLFKEIDPQMESTMKNENVVIHYHTNCITPQNFSTSGLDQFFKVLAVNQDSRNTTFVDVIEARNYPYYGVTFHPEKVVFEWADTKTHHNIPHTAEAIKVTQYFGNFFISEARKNEHQFSSKTEEDKILIYNYNPVFTGKLKNNAVVQKYYFS